MKPWMGYALDALVIVCLTVLLALRAIPVEVALPMFALVIGAKATHRGPGDPPPPPELASSPAPASSSAVASAVKASSVLTLLSVLIVPLLGLLSRKAS